MTLLLLTTAVHAQHRITGKVIDIYKEALIGANVYIEGTFEGASTQEKGMFEFSTSQDTGTLVISYLGYQTHKTFVDFTTPNELFTIKLIPRPAETGVVVITAGAFEAGDEKKGVVLNSLDIATTAGAQADIATALNTLPGTQRVAESGQLFVRGGNAHETRVFMDGLRIPNPFTGTVPDIPSRGRFSPFLFKGMLFSTGGYSAEYGQALSAALTLETEDLPEQHVTGISLMSVGAEIAHTQRWAQQALTLSGSYTNLDPYHQLIPQYLDWEQSPVSYTGRIQYHHQMTSGGIYKTLATYTKNRLQVKVPSLTTPNEQAIFANQNDFFFVKSSMKELLGDKWVLRGGFAYTYNREYQIHEGGTRIHNQQTTQGKWVLTYPLTRKILLKTGATYLAESFREEASYLPISPTSLTDHYVATFSEMNWQISPKWAARLGLRGEYTSLIAQSNLAPRLSLAYQTGRHSQVSLAWGNFFQTPDYSLLRVTSELQYEQANHLILNYQYQKNRQTFRVEGYRKNYQDLVRFDPLGPFDPTTYNNLGHGYAHGIELFWRDQKSIDGADYWISYSWLDTKRLHRDFPQASIPNFASTHNLSIVGKYFWDALNTQIGMTYSWASPRTYHNLNEIEFQQNKTSHFHDLSLNTSYLTSIAGHFTIIHFSISNILGSNQILGYRYAMYQNDVGEHPEFAVRPPAKRFLFLGLFISIE